MPAATGIVGEFLALKDETDADVLAMQVGDFYEFFGDDAELVADELDLKTSEKSSQGGSYPMAGVPVADLTPYLKGLVERGYRVAVADQHDGADGPERAITRVVTPGTLLETTDADARYLAAIVDDGDAYGLAFADVTTGQFVVTSTDDVDAALSECYRFDPAEVIPGPDIRDDDALDRLRDHTDARLTLHDDDAFAPGRATHVAREHFGRETFDSVGATDAAVRAAGAVLAYVDATDAGVLASMTRVRTLADDDRVTLDATTQRNLELTETMQGDADGSLLATVDHTVTSAGRRRLAAWLQRPRRDVHALRDRQAAVDALATAALARDGLRESLGDAYDLERLASKATSASADPRDLARVRDTLSLVPVVHERVADDPTLADSPLASVLDADTRERAAALRDELDAALVDDPPQTTTQGGIFARGYDDAIDDARDRHEAAQEYFDTLEETVKRETGLTHVTVDRNKTDGWYVQVGKSEADGMPERFREVKTLKNSRRFVTDELEERERDLVQLEDRRSDLERDRFAQLRADVADHAALLQDVGRAFARVDAFASFAEHAVANDWTRPELTTDDVLDVDAGRHPVVEQTTEFVPNDLQLDDDRRFAVVTGPNMSGKSTYMRQTALIVLLAQVGSFVPADAATVGVVDGVFTRVGALDELAQGRSTFMVEMTELANILHTATEDSLVILDEVGRGTATYDGISIAWAATEYLHNEVRAKTLFATHYHELTTLADHLERVVNVHVAADERDGDVTFLRTVREGPTDRSYGVHVADLAGVPGPVVDRSREVLDRLREDEAIEARGSDGADAGGGTQQVVFDLDDARLRASDDGAGEAPASADGGATAGSASDGDAGDDPVAAGAVGDGDQGVTDREREVLAELADVDVAETAPVELLSRVQAWQERLADEE
ncbi:DNA mismatch repair protein MutS [Halorubellus sp. PRR65]|uniref:DNA mismatch repair protein MutS n=1 Tax=Halorubellus sp. PRR65 TaxID=3098148 RepID=UPI002B260D95|nr:DNA mismatch repair protein MutS [Halorubellus sp. PRR65]